VFFSQVLDAAHILTLNCDEMAVDRPRQPVHEIFSITRGRYLSKSDPLSSRRPAQAGVKVSYRLKVVILPQLSCAAWKRLQIGTNMLLIITSNSDKLFAGVNVNDIE